jgi:hypothetical protein
VSPYSKECIKYAHDRSRRSAGSVGSVKKLTGCTDSGRRTSWHCSA